MVDNIYFYLEFPYFLSPPKWIIYNGISHLKRALKTLDFQNFGEVFAHFLTQIFLRLLKAYVSIGGQVMKNLGLIFLTHWIIAH